MPFFLRDEIDERSEQGDAMNQTVVGLDDPVCAIQSDEALKHLADQIRRGECILFFGAGVHAAPPENCSWKYPRDIRPLLGGDLAERLAAECGFGKQLPEESTRDLQRVSLYFEKTLGRADLISLLNKHLMSEKEPSPILKMLAGLPFSIIVTTNYDRLGEAALRGQKKDPKVVIYDPGLDRLTRDITGDPTKERPLLFKMHGDFDQEESIVITDEDYITFVQRMSDKDAFHPVPMTIRFRMQRWSILFVGYSLRDYNIRLLFRTLRWRVDPANFPLSFAIDHNPDPLILKVWQDERHFITFVTQDLWSVVPNLYKQVMGKEYEDA